MNTQTNNLFNVTLPTIPAHIASLLAAYVPTTPDTTLNMNLYPEPYYGDFNNCSLVMLTHNPGGSNNHWKGMLSNFEHNITTHPISPSSAYFAMASLPNFPNPATNNWIIKINTEIQNHFAGIQNFNKALFVRDLIPYHSSRFGIINMSLCSDYLYRYFFNQVIQASFTSEIYHRINSKEIKPSTIIYARGKAWKDNLGLKSIGWDMIGRIYSYCYIFKANFNEIMKIKGFDINNYPTATLDHNIYIVVITQIREGAKYGIYSTYRDLNSLINLNAVVNNYYNVTNRNDFGYIIHNKEMDTFIDTIR